MPAKPAAIPHEVRVLRECAIVPRSAAEADLAATIYSELARLAAGHGLQLGGSACNQDGGRQVLAVGGMLDLVALDRRMLEAGPALEHAARPSD